MKRPDPANLTLIDPGTPTPARPGTGHVRERRTGTKRSLTTVELTIPERKVLDQLAESAGSSRAEVMRNALRAFALEHGQTIPEEARPAA